MRQMKKLLMAAAVVCCLAVLAGSPAKALAALSSADTAKVTMNLNLRSSMTTSGDNVLLVIPKGKVVDILAGPENGWYRVSYKTQSGYVSGKYLAENTDLVTTNVRLNMRNSMKTTTKDNILLVIPKGKSVPVISRYTNGWYKVKYKSKTGYVNGEYLTDPRLNKTAKKVTAVALNLRSSKDTSVRDNIILTIPKGATVTVSGKAENGWVKVVYNKKTGYVKEKYLKTAAASTTVTRVTKYKVNMRSSMNTEDSTNIILTIPKGEKVTVLASGSGWYKVTYNNKTGYVKAGYFV